MHPSFFVRTLTFVSLAIPAAAQQLLSTYTGSVGDEFGAAVIQTADQNGDGWPDLLIGAPGYNAGRGYVRALSGRFLATGAGPAVLWTLMPSVNAGARFGSSIAEVATLTGNIATDYVVGAPGYIPSGTTTTGALLLIDGSTHTVASTITGEANTQLGQHLVAVGDQDGDGKIDVAASAIPVSLTNNNAKIHVVTGAAFTSGTHALATVTHWTRSAGWHDAGAALASGFDLDGDGKFDLAFGVPSYGFSNPSAGYVEVCKADSTLGLLGAYVPPVTGERFGSSIDARYDVDGDGVVDLIVGAPGFNPGSGNEVGRALVISGWRFFHPSSTPPEIFDLRIGATATSHFGACVRSSIDLNNDGVADFIVGAPDYLAINHTTPIKGAAIIFSGATGMSLGALTGASNDQLGDALLGGGLDMNGDGFPDFAVAGSLSDNSTVNCGTLKFYSLFPSVWSSYCTGKVNSLGCVPIIQGNGTASLSSTGPFAVQSYNTLNQVNGLMIYSHSPSATPFQGGTLCINTPLARTLVQSSGGNAGAPDCSGLFSFDFNAHIHSGVDPTLIVGAEIFCQYWSRDSASTSTTSLSNGLRFMINP